MEAFTDTLPIVCNGFKEKTDNTSDVGITVFMLSLFEIASRHILYNQLITLCRVTRKY